MSLRDDIANDNYPLYDISRHPEYQHAPEHEDRKSPKSLARRRANRDLEARLIEEFKVKIFEELGLSEHPKRDRAWSIACSNSSGWVEIYNTLEELADLMLP